MPLLPLLVVLNALAPGGAVPDIDAFGRCFARPAATAGEVPAIHDCYTRALGREDDILNAEYRSAMRRLPPARRRGLRDAERAWVMDRDRRCEREAAPDMGEMGDTQDSQLSRLSCLIDQTQRRAEALRRLR